MMNRRAQENVIAVAILIVFVGAIVMCLGFGPRARLVALPLSIFGLILTLTQIIWQNLRSAGELKVDLLEVLTGKTEEQSVPGAAGESSGEEAAPANRRPQWQREFAANGIVALFLGLTLLIGPIPAVFVFTCGYLLLSKHYSWGRALVYTAFFTASLYLLFVVVLELQLYHGVLEPIFSRS